MTAAVRFSKPCDECGGTGIVEPPISGNDPHGAFANGPCPSCVGGVIEQIGPSTPTIRRSSSAVSADTDTMNPYNE